jgi:CRP/FNR family transcriptional regulator, anaerobic regulatory protein
MLDHLMAHIKLFVPVSEKLAERITTIAELQHIAKGKFLHRPQQVCHHTYFINSGLLRTYYKKGNKDITDNFAAEGEWLTSIQSFMQNVPDYFYIEALEPSELLAIHVQALEECFQDFPEMERFGRLLLSKYFLEQSERILSLQFHSAKERYAFFCKTAGNKTARVPLGMLASHLGMTQETLSRIRSSKTGF